MVRDRSRVRVGFRERARDTVRVRAEFGGG